VSSIPDNKDIWHRPEFRDRPDELESRSEYEQRRQLKPSVLSARFRDYADRVPALVVERWRSGVYPEKVYVSAELDDFLATITGHDQPRSSVEVAQAEVVRRRGTVEEYTRRRDAKRKELDKSERALDVQARKLKKAEENLEMERQLAEE
jgi:hypothetical protein